VVVVVERVVQWHLFLPKVGVPFSFALPMGMDAFIYHPRIVRKDLRMDTEHQTQSLPIKYAESAFVERALTCPSKL